MTDNLIDRLIRASLGACTCDPAVKYKENHQHDEFCTFRLLDEAAAALSAQRIEARSDETLQAAQPEGQEPGPKDAPNPTRRYP